MRIDNILGDLHSDKTKQKIKTVNIQPMSKRFACYISMQKWEKQNIWQETFYLCISLVEEKVIVKLHCNQSVILKMYIQCLVPHEAFGLFKEKSQERKQFYITKPWGGEC